MTARVTVSLPQELLDRLDSIAQEQDVSRSDVVREAAAAYVAHTARGTEASLRESAVDDGIEWLELVASREPLDPRPGLEILRELRGDTPPPCASIEPAQEHLP